MKEGPDTFHVAALIGDPARANMLTVLMSGKALTVTELAEEVGVTIQTASSRCSSRWTDYGCFEPKLFGAVSSTNDGYLSITCQASASL